MGLTITTPPTAEPIAVMGLETARDHLRVDDDAENGLLRDAAADALAWVESECWRQVLTATLTLTLPRFTTPILLPRPPAVSVTSVTYVDGNGDSQQLAEGTDFEVHADREPAEIRPVVDGAWPATRAQPDAVTIVYVAGYGLTWASLPGALRRAWLLSLGDFYEFRETERRPGGADARDALLGLVRFRDERIAEVL